VILSQIVRGAADVLGSAERIDPPVVARAFRAATDAAYRAVRRPVEGTMLSAIREMAEEAETQAPEAVSLAELLAAVVGRGEEAVARTPEQLEVLRDAGVVDAGAAGLLELVRGIAAALAGEPLPEAQPQEELAVEGIHQGLSRYRYCTVFVTEGEQLDREAVEQKLERLGDSLLVVGDATALKVHVHTDDPGGALAVGTAIGTIAGVEIANMHAQTEQREERLLHAVPDSGPNVCDVVAVVAGEGNRRLFESLGAARVVEGGQTMNPSTADLVDAVEATSAPEAILLPDNANVIMTAEQAAQMSSKPVQVVQTRSVQAGLSSLVLYDPSRSAADNAREMREALAGVATGEVTVASRDVTMNGLSIRKGEYLGLADEVPVAGGRDFDDVAARVVKTLLAEPRDVLTLLTGEEEPPLESLLERLATEHPELELEVHEGGQPHYPLLLSAE
jgi:DAK2 domain fusion protein YloV